MSGPDDSTGGIFASAQRLGRSIFGLFTTRLELFTVELQEEKLRALSLLVWLSIAVTLGVAAVLVAVGTLALFLWHTAGYAGLIGLAAVLFAAAAATLVWLRRQVLHGPEPFAATVAEFKKDMACLHHDE